MGFHLLLSHVDGFFGAIDQPEVAHIADHRPLLPVVLVLDKVQVNLLGEPVVALKLSFPDIQHIDSLVGAGAHSQLVHSLVAQDKGSLVAVAAVRLLVLERHDVGIAEGGIDGQVIGGGLERRLDHRHRSFIHGLL